MRHYYLFLVNILNLILLSKIEGKSTYQYPIFQSNDCRPNKLAVMHPMYDSHLTWVLSPTCDLAVKYNWDTGIFIKQTKHDYVPSNTLSGSCSDIYENQIFTNFDNGTLFIIFTVKNNNDLQNHKVHFNVVVVDTVELWNSKIPYINILEKVPENVTFVEKLTLINDTDFQSCIGNKNNVSISVICVYGSQKRHYQYFLNNFNSTQMTLKETIIMDVLLTENNKYFLHYYQNTLYILHKKKYFMDELIYADTTRQENCEKINDCHPGFILPNMNNEDLFYYKISSIKDVGIILDTCQRLSPECTSYFLPDNKILDSYVCTHAKSYVGGNIISSGVIPIANPYVGLFSSMTSSSCSAKKSHIPKKYIL